MELLVKISAIENGLGGWKNYAFFLQRYPYRSGKGREMEADPYPISYG